jgi:hypothetical protein
MNKVFKNDLMEIIKTLKKTNKESVKLQCIKDYNLLMNLLSYYFPHEIDHRITMPDVTSYTEDEIYEKDNQDRIRNEILANIDSLLELYEQMITLFNNFNIDPVEYDNDVEEIDFSQISDFLYDYPKIQQIFNKIIDSEHLIYIEGSNASYTYVLPSINREYILACLDEPNETEASIVHEVSHIYQERITYNTNMNNYLNEFIPILMEHLFLEYYKGIDYKLSRKQIINRLNIWKKVTLESYAQLKLLKENPESFDGFIVKDEYKEELDKLCETDYTFLRDSLYIQFYPLGFMMAMSYFYALQYGMDSNEIDKFYIENNNNLRAILDNIDIDSLREYLINNITNKKRK